jgi:hypothetical protein
MRNYARLQDVPSTCFKLGLLAYLAAEGPEQIRLQKVSLSGAKVSLY